MKNLKHQSGGFTIIELMVVMSVLVSLCMTVGGLYIIFHFINKFW
jgi:prepilin-type N-terminal cleavage/methylation domain-containing protein